MVMKWNRSSLGNTLEIWLGTSKRMYMTMNSEVVDLGLSIQNVICFWVFALNTHQK